MGETEAAARQPRNAGYGRQIGNACGQVALFAVAVLLVVAPAPPLSSASGTVPVTWSSTGPMSTGRYFHTATLLPSGQVLVAGGGDDSADLYDPRSGQFTPTGRMTTARQYHTATLLLNGMVLIAGGTGGTIAASSELYDPRTGRWTASGDMSTGRYLHTATLLHSGKVLVVGGINDTSAELYDPQTGLWTPTGSISTSRSAHTATLLLNGKVLVAGGRDANGTLLSTAELYDPTTGVWTTTGSMTIAREFHTATPLLDGKVLVAGGDTPKGTAFSAEIYDPTTGRWAATGSMATARSDHTATRLPSGKVLVAGGCCYAGAQPPTSSELYDSTTGTWTAAGALTAPRYDHTATLLPGGRVLLTGGEAQPGVSSSSTASAEVYENAPLVLSPSTLTFGIHIVSTWSATQAVTVTNNTAAALTVERVQVRGPNQTDFTVTTTCTLKALPTGDACTVFIRFRPGASGTRRATLDVMSTTNGSINQSLPLFGIGARLQPGAWTQLGQPPRGFDGQTATLLRSGRILFVGSSNAYLYDPSTNSWSATAPMSTIRDGHTATLLSNGTVLVAGGEAFDHGDEFATNGEIYDPAHATWAVTSDMTTGRASHTATLLHTGKVLVVGGYGCSVQCGAVARAEVYDPRAASWSATPPFSWSPTPPLHVGRQRHTATLLADGRVLVVGGCCAKGGSQSLASAEIFDPKANTWTLAAPMHDARQGHAATLLPNGTILVAGGCCAPGRPVGLASAEVYNPRTNRWVMARPMHVMRVGQAAITLPNGNVLMAGGSRDGTAEVYAWRTGTWTRVSHMSAVYNSPMATLLPSGQVFVAGTGYDATTEVYEPAQG